MHQNIILFISYVFMINKDMAIGLVMNGSITTAVSRGNISPKPTSTINRTNFDTYETSSTLHHQVDRRRKISTRSLIWKWDHWCQLQPRRGNCNSNLTKYYYDSRLDQCSQFTYSGCNGNKNSFENVFDCELHCKGTFQAKIEQFTKPVFCSLQPQIGVCLGLATRYYYDVNENICKEFIYGGCGGNQNNFETILACKKTCTGEPY